MSCCSKRHYPFLQCRLLDVEFEALDVAPSELRTRLHQVCFLLPRHSWPNAGMHIPRTHPLPTSRIAKSRTWLRNCLSRHAGRAADNKLLGDRCLETVMLWPQVVAPALQLVLSLTAQLPELAALRGQALDLTL